MGKLCTKCTYERVAVPDVPGQIVIRLTPALLQGAGVAFPAAIPRTPGAMGPHRLSVAVAGAGPGGAAATRISRAGSCSRG